MKLPKKSKKTDVEISNLYAIKLRTIWQSVKQEHISFWALTAYFFFEYVRPQSIYPVLEVVPWGQLTLLTALISAFFDRSVSWVSNAENKLFILFFLIVILSSVFAFRPSVSWDHSTHIINWLLLYFLVINVINSERRLLIFILAYLLFSFKMAQHGFFVWAGRGFAFTKWGLIGAGGYFQNSGEFAIQMLIFGTLALAFVLALREYWGRYKKWFFYFMPLSAFMSVMGASSRGSQLALAVIGLLTVIKVRAGIKLLLVFILFFAALVYFLPEEQVQRFSNMGEDRSSRQRISYWVYGIDVLNDNPVIGIGYKNWNDYIRFHQPAELGDGREEPHNIFIKVGAELGYSGLLCFMLMILFVFIINARTRRVARRGRHKLFEYLAYGLDAGLIGYLVAGFFVTVVYYPFFWVQMAMTVALHSVSKNQLSKKEVVEKLKVKSYHS